MTGTVRTAITALVAAGIHLGCSQGDAGPEAIRVGHVASMTGDTATFGQSADRGMQLAIQEINAAGGGPGRPPAPLTADDPPVTAAAPRPPPDPPPRGGG